MAASRNHSRTLLLKVFSWALKRLKIHLSKSYRHCVPLFFVLFYCWKIVGPLLAVQAIMPVLALPSTPIIMERGTFELICNGSKRPLVGLICDWSRRPRGHIPPPYSLNGQDSGTACEKYNSLLNNYLDLD